MKLRKKLKLIVERKDVTYDLDINNLKLSLDYKRSVFLSIL